jgi:hypothetical protein
MAPAALAAAPRNARREASCAAGAGRAPASGQPAPAQGSPAAEAQRAVPAGPHAAAADGRRRRRRDRSDPPPLGRWQRSSAASTLCSPPRPASSNVHQPGCWSGSSATGPWPAPVSWATSTRRPRSSPSAGSNPATYDRSPRGLGRSRPPPPTGARCQGAGLRQTSGQPRGQAALGDPGHSFGPVQPAKAVTRPRRRAFGACPRRSARRRSAAAAGRPRCVVRESFMSAPV